MSNRERVMQLIEGIPDIKLHFVIEMLESLKAYAGEEIEPDEWDLQMIEAAEKENNGETIALEDLANELGVVL
ncbi:MAG: hypothetical protein NC302_09430 [Bacteroidales bacterium]|nr:hypothetical protein [Bacteroidales bacterium]MCM1416068.1 hypothetical protein [bacterium]MCM1422795.1 hypothetical protein [bacterium]